jgi:hypothetical protein
VVIVVPAFKGTVSVLLSDGSDRLVTELVLTRRVTVRAENTAVTQCSHSHAIPTTWSPVRRGANLRKEEVGERNQERQSGGDTDVSGAHAQELC